MIELISHLDGWYISGSDIFLTLIIIFFSPPPFLKQQFRLDDGYFRITSNTTNLNISFAEGLVFSAEHSIIHCTFYIQTGLTRHSMHTKNIYIYIFTEKSAVRNYGFQRRWELTTRTCSWLFFFVIAKDVHSESRALMRAMSNTFYQSDKSTISPDRYPPSYH